MDDGKFVEMLEELNNMKEQGIIGQAEYEKQVNDLKKQYKKANNYFGINFVEKKAASRSSQNSAITFILLIIAISLFGIWFFTSGAFDKLTNKGQEIVDNYEEISNVRNENGLRNDFKRAMDSYEETMNAYVNFMVNYTNSNGMNNPQLLKEYSEWLKKYLDTLEAFNSWKGKDLNLEEAKYYVEVQRRVSQKFIDASIEMNYR